MVGKHLKNAVKALPVVVILTVSLAATFLLWRYESRLTEESYQLRFTQASDEILGSISETMIAYGQFLRSSVAMLNIHGDLTRDKWATYVAASDLKANFPDIQGVSFNPILHSRAEVAALEAKVQATDRADFQVKPTGDRSLFAPVLYLEPLNESNQRAIGFDIYSEDLRRAAIERAIETGEISMTAKITLVQEDAQDAQAGVLVILPTYKSGTMPATAAARRADINGVVVAVFRLGDLVTSVLARNASRQSGTIHVTLRDENATAADTLFTTDQTVVTQSQMTQVLPVFGRTWTLTTGSTADFDAGTQSQKPTYILYAGIIMSLMLALIAAEQMRRSNEQEQKIRTARANSAHVETLLQEISHRSKNLLALVRAIARLTADAGAKPFLQRFSERIEGLSASQDLLIQNQWRGTTLEDVAAAQLAFLDDLIGSRVHISGPAQPLSASSAQALGMALHELATNAGKYGALSNDSGEVDLTWSQDPEGTFRIDWIERGGPPVAPAQHRGFGSAVIGQMAEHALSGQAQSSFETGGFSWCLTCPAAQLVQKQNSAIPQDANTT